MPFKHIEPNVYIVLKGVKVWVTFSMKHGPPGEASPYLFTTSENETDYDVRSTSDGDYVFDVRELNSWKTLTSQSHGKLRKPSAETAMIIKAIQNAILSGEVKAPPKPKKAGKKK